MTVIRKQFKRVILGISGGIDSAVAGLILKKKGFDVHGLFMKNWDIADETGTCSIDQDLQDATQTCSSLNIPLHEVNFSKDYWNYVFTQTLDQYQSGETPNPDILCNRYIKFNKFVEYSFKKFDADAIATGHYAQSTFGNFLEWYNKDEGVHLLKAVDSFKDQTFFLNQVHQRALQKTMFPVGNLTKSQVKKIALENNFHHLLAKRESTGICFIGHREFSKFISEYVRDKKGRLINIDTGRVEGTHNGIHHWTIGQRCRIGGCTNRLYIAKKNLETQDILVASGNDHPALWSCDLTTAAPHWIHSIPKPLRNGLVFKCDFRFQHTKPLTPCRVMLRNDGTLMVSLDTPKFALTPGQYAVFYKDNECLGGAKIENTAPSLYSLSKFNKIFPK